MFSTHKPATSFTQASLIAIAPAESRPAAPPIAPIARPGVRVAAAPFAALGGGAP